MKILHLPVLNTYSGVIAYLRERMHRIDGDKFRFDFLTFGGKLDLQEEIESFGGRVHYITARAEENKEKFIEEINAVLEEGYDVVHLHTSFWKSFLMEELAIAKKVPKIIVHSHSTQVDIIDDEKRNEAISLHETRKKEFSLDLATDFCACSHLAAEWLFGAQIPRERIQILNNAIDTEKFAFSSERRKEVREKLGIKNNFVIGHVGRFTYQKNHTFLLSLVKKLSITIPEIRLLLIGVGPLEEETRDLVKEYEIEEQILFLGNREDVPALMSGMDLFLLPSRFEGLPLVLVEGQCSGLPCISSDLVTKEVALTDLIRFFPLEEDLWVEAVKTAYDAQGKVKRKSQEDLLKEVGYDLNTQVKVLEELYSAK